MQNFLQQNGPTVTATPHVKPVLHGDSGTRSQSSDDSHSAVHRPLLPSGYIEPIGSMRPSGTRRHVRDTQSSDGEATTTSDGAGAAVPRSQMRPTGLLVQAASASPMTTASRIIAPDNKGAGAAVKRTNLNNVLSRLRDPMGSIR